MQFALQRSFTALTLFVIFAIALGLRFYGMDWGFKDGAGSFHPDERFYESCAASLRPQWLSEAERDLPFRERVDLLIERNLRVNPNQPYQAGNPGLRPPNYNYGTLPTHLYLGYRSYLAHNQREYFESFPEARAALQQSLPPGSQGGAWRLLRFPDALSLGLLAIALIVGFRLFLSLSRDLRLGRPSPVAWYADHERMLFAMFAFALPLAGLALTFSLPHWLVDLSRYDPERSSILLVGRMITAWGGALTVLFVYLIGRDAYRPLAGLIGAAMLATAMLHTQTSHFATVDVLLGLFTTVAVYAFLKISQTGRWRWYALAALASGCAIGTKWSGILLIGILLVAQAIHTLGRVSGAERFIHLSWLALAGVVLLHFLRAASSLDPTFDRTLAAFRDFYLGNLWWMLPLAALWFAATIFLLSLQMIWEGREAGLFRRAWRLYRPWLALSITVALGLCAVYAAQPMAFHDSQAFASHIIEQTRMHSSGERPVWFTEQFHNTPPVFYSLDNLFYPSLDWLTAFFVVAGCLFALYRIVSGKNPADLLLCSWVFPTFILFSTSYSKFPRYMLICLPIMMVFGGRLIAELMRLQPAFFTPEAPWLTPKHKRWARGFGYAGGGAALLCGLLYAIAYVSIYQHPHTLVQADRFIRENLLPSGARVMVNNVDEGPSYGLDIGFHYAGPSNHDPQAVFAYYAEKLSQTDYLVFRSKRPYGSTLQYAEKYPHTNQVLRMLFAEQLGFRVMRVFKNTPRLGPFEFRVDEEDETARIYERPKVILFERTQPYDRAQLARIMENPPTWVDEITASDILRLREGYPVFTQPPSHPVLRWWIAIQLAGAIGFLLFFPLASRLPDRGYGVSKAIGLALYSWLVWLSASIGVAQNTPLTRAGVMAILAVFAFSLAIRHREELRVFFARRWKLIVGIEALYLAAWGFFLTIRAYHPSIIWGEKPMNFSFVNAVYRAASFPPEDPWISGEAINYYYYGHAVFAILGQFSGLDPERFFNIAGTSVAALVAVAVFSIVYALCGRAWLALLGVFLCVFSSHLIAFSHLLKHGRVAYGGEGSLIEGLRMLGVWIGAAVPTYLGIGNADTLSLVRSISYDQIFWASSRVIPNTAANEFPYWTHLFMDFHAHMLVVPFSLAFLGALYALFARPLREIGALAWGGYLFFLALLLGTVTCTNTWDLPGLGIALSLALAIKFWRESALVAPHAPRVAWFSPESVQSFLRFPIAPILAILLLSWALLFPFHHHFESRVTSVGWMTEGQTQPQTYFLWWAHLLIPLVALVVGLAFFRRDGRFSLVRSGLFITLFAASVAAAGWISATNPFEYPPSISAEFPLDYRVFGLMAPFLAVIFFALWNRSRPAQGVFAFLIAFIGLGLSLGIELFYIKEGWTIPSHRWNTAFKFNLQTWHFLALFAPVAAWMVWDLLGRIGVHIGRWFTWTTRLGFAFSFGLLLAATLPFSLLAPAMVTLTPGAEYRDARGSRPTLDGFTWLRDEAPSDYAAIQWFQRFTPGSPNIVEMPDGYYNEVSRFSANTGLPTVIGWAHHVGERLHHDQKLQRTRDADRVYLSTDKEEVRRLLARYRVEYVLFGQVEMRKRRENHGRFTSYGAASLERLEGWPDLLERVYRNGETSIFRVIRGVGSKDAVVVESTAPAREGARPSVTMFEGGPGEEIGQFREPRGLAVDRAGYVYVADTFNHRIQVFRPGGVFVWSVGTQGVGTGEFREPNELVIADDIGYIFVADTWNNRLAVLDKFGNFIGATADIPFFGPRGIAYHSETKRIYITDTGNHFVRVIEGGQLVDTWGTPGGGSGEGAFREPVGIDVSPDGHVVVADSLNLRVKVYTAAGELLRVFPIETSAQGPGAFEAHIACAPDGSIYLTDPLEASVHVYNSEGELLRKIVRDLRGQPLRKPVGVAITPEGRALVTDLIQNRVVAVE